MRVISGTFKGIRIYAPRHKKIKPTSSTVRKAIFDYLQDWVKSKEVLDLYAGTGALGIEALSRGAARAVFVEKDPICVRTINKNLAQLKGARSEIMPMDVRMALSLLRGEIFELIFIDPPYREKLVESTLRELSEYGIVNENSLVVAEHHKKELIRERIGDFVLAKQKKYGETVISFFKMLSRAELR
jgi:16S rRNA (guanine(966)-N(2))-methyltransferase RsmD